MIVGQAKQTLRTWVQVGLDDYPGLCGAHLVGGITGFPDTAFFPEYKDVDLHLILEEGSPALQSTNPFENNLEISYDGLMIEGGLKPRTDYASAEAVLANPEIAYHLTRDSILYDPQGFLHNMQARVKEEYPRRQWVKARCEYERHGLDGVMALLPMARQMDASGAADFGLLGYSTTFLIALMCVATLQAPTTGSTARLKLRAILTEYNQLELYEAFTSLLGVESITPAQASQLIQEAEALFDTAVLFKRTPIPFGHKLRAHLRPYFVDSCRTMLNDGHFGEAATWSIPFYMASCNTMLVDGPDDQRPYYAQKLLDLLSLLGLDSVDWNQRWAQARQLYDAFFALAAEVVERNPDVVG